ncbi:hypothetical protein HYFRA_00008560 [Hymenoscyphus fraxineus]|uniref:Ankyrin n=1 Tax=Hymenoscyphus fraxineus TaxID=746836 RepID=A0A9N9KY13_9HELO|nr:hypothetical protein HYFRA_00008560 [Hymenoscyphus fraxineus]
MPKKGVDVSSESFGAPLYGAVFKGHLEVGEILLDAGAAMNFKWEGQTYLEAAREMGHTEIGELLIIYQKKVEGVEEMLDDEAPPGQHHSACLQTENKLLRRNT